MSDFLSVKNEGLKITNTQQIPTVDVNLYAPIVGGIAFDIPTNSFKFADGTNWVTPSGVSILAGDVTGPSNGNTVVGIQNRPVVVTAPILNQALVWNGVAWAPSFTASAGVNTFSGGTTGLTPAVPTAGNIVLAGILSAANGGSGLNASAAPNGNLLIGNGAGFNLSALTAGAGISITNGVGTITINATGGGSTWSGGTTGMTPIPPTSGPIVLGGILVPANGGTGLDGSTATFGTLLIGNGAGYTLNTLTAGSGITITNGIGAITISTVGDVTSFSAGTTGLTPNVPTTGAIVLGGILSVANGGTNASAALNNNRIMVSTGGMIVESGALSNGQLLIGNTGFAPVISTLTAGVGISITNGAGSITIDATGAGAVTTFQTSLSGLSPAVPTMGAVTLSGTLGATSGGTGQTVYVVGDLLYADTTTTLAKLADVVVGSYLRSGGVGVVPAWSTLTLPDTATTGDILYATSANTIGVLADVATGSAVISGGIGATPMWGKIDLTAAVSGVLPIVNGGTNSGTPLNNNRIMVSSVGAIVEASALANGQLLIGSTGAAPVAANITAGSGITITNGAGTISIATNGVGAVTSFQTSLNGLTPSIATTGAVTLAGTLGATSGGTGQTGYIVGDILYADTTTTLAKLADIATGNALLSGGIGVAPSWGKVNLTNAVTGILPVANGGTGLNGSTASNGQLLIGNGTGYTLNTITAGTGISVSNGVGTISISASAATSPQIVTINTDDNSVGGLGITYSYPWQNARYSGYTTRKVTLWVIPSSGIGKDLTVNTSPNGGPSIGSITILGGAAVGAIYTFTFTDPGVDTRLDFVLTRSGAAGNNPRVQGITLELT